MCRALESHLAAVEQAHAQASTDDRYGWLFCQAGVTHANCSVALNIGKRLPVLTVMPTSWFDETQSDYSSHVLSLYVATQMADPIGIIQNKLGMLKRTEMRRVQNEIVLLMQSPPSVALTCSVVAAYVGLFH
jgi:hypothetical protein